MSDYEFHSARRTYAADDREWGYDWPQRGMSYEEVMRAMIAKIRRLEERVQDLEGDRHALREEMRRRYAPQLRAAGNEQQQHRRRIVLENNEEG